MLSETVIELEMVISNFKDLIQSLTNAMTFSHSGHISVDLMSPKILINSLEELQKTDKYNVPTFEINLSNYALIMKISETVVYLKGSKLVTLLRVPIAENDKFTAFKFIPVPENVGIINKSR